MAFALVALTTRIPSGVNAGEGLQALLFARIGPPATRRRLTVFLTGAGVQVGALVLAWFVSFLASIAIQKRPPVADKREDRRLPVVIVVGAAVAEISPDREVPKPAAVTNVPVAVAQVPSLQLPPKPKPKVATDWAIDSEKELPAVLAQWRAAVGFAKGQRVVRKFMAPGWEAAVLPDEGVNLDKFYYLRIDELTGSYDFLNKLRAQEEALQSLLPFALLGGAFQNAVEKEVREKSACPEGANLSATLKLGAGGIDGGRGFHVVGPVRCVPGSELP